jgi:hypothetical protein
MWSTTLQEQTPQAARADKTAEHCANIRCGGNVALGQTKAKRRAWPSFTSVTVGSMKMRSRSARKGLFSALICKSTILAAHYANVPVSIRCIGKLQSKRIFLGMP